MQDAVLYAVFSVVVLFASYHVAVYSFNVGLYLGKKAMIVYAFLFALTLAYMAWTSDEFVDEVHGVVKHAASRDSVAESVQSGLVHAVRPLYAVHQTMQEKFHQTLQYAVDLAVQGVNASAHGGT